MDAWSGRRFHRHRHCGFGGGAWNDLSRFRSGFSPWRRLPAEGVLAGVCAGLARALNVQPLLVRLGFVAAGLASGPFAVLGYIVLAAVLPVEEEARPNDKRQSDAGAETAAASGSAYGAQSASAELAALRARLEDFDRRAAALERRVVADHLDPAAAELDRAIRDLEKGVGR